MKNILNLKGSEKTPSKETRNDNMGQIEYGWHSSKELPQINEKERMEYSRSKMLLLYDEENDTYITGWYIRTLKGSRWEAEDNTKRLGGYDDDDWEKMEYKVTHWRYIDDVPNDLRRY